MSIAAISAVLRASSFTWKAVYLLGTRAGSFACCSVKSAALCRHHHGQILLRFTEIILPAQINVKALIQRQLDRPNVREAHRRIVATAAKHLKRKAQRLYDMGCGAGTVMTEAKAIGIEPDGNDVNKCGIDMLREMGLQARHGFTHELDLPSNAYDIVANLDYLEHTYVPFDDLRTCARILAPRGILYLKTLYLGSPIHWLRREKWKMFGQSHFSFFSEGLLKRMVVGAGFEILKTALRFEMITIIARRLAVEEEAAR